MTDPREQPRGTKRFVLEKACVRWLLGTLGGSVASWFLMPWRQFFNLSVGTPAIVSFMVANLIGSA
jgi:hypothetical protein